MKTAFATKELGLGLTVTPVGVAALVAPLRGMPGVHGNDLAAGSLRFVLKEALELGEAPGVEPSFGFPTRSFDATPDVGEVFHDDSRTGLDAVKNRGRQHVVAIPSEALFTPSEASKVPFSTLSTLGLQNTSETKDSLDNFLHMPVTVKTVVRSNGRPGNPQVDADGLAITDKSDIGQADDGVKIELPFMIDEIGGSRSVANRVLGILGKGKHYPGSAAGSGQVHDSFFPVYLEGVQVVPGRTHCGLRATYPAPLLHPGNSRPHSLAGFLTGLNVQVGDEVGQSILATAVGQAVKRVGVTGSLLPARTADSVKRVSKLLNCLMQGFNLFFTWLKPYSHRPIHIQSIPYATRILQIRRKEAGQFLCQLKQAVPLP